jgi:glycosyltransferase involved in cell wall biosynthesis
MPRDPGVKYNSILRASANRLNLLSHASGGYFCILDGDDWYVDNGFIRDALNVLEADPSLAICAFNFQMFQDGKIDTVIPLPRSGRYSAKEYISRYYVHAGSCVFRQANDASRISLLSRCGYYDDNDIVINNLALGDVYYLDKVAYSYRQTGASAWTAISVYEKNVINAINYDVLAMYAPRYAREVAMRNFGSLYHTWLRRNSASAEIEAINEKYHAIAAGIENCLFDKIAAYGSLPKAEKLGISLFVFRNCLRRPIRALFEFKQFAFPKTDRGHE